MTSVRVSLWRAGVAWAVCFVLAAGWALAASAAGARVRARIPGPVPVLVEAEQITMLPSGVVRASGAVEITRGEDTLHAREAVYDPATEEVEATGDAVLSQPGRRLTGQHLRYSARTGDVSGDAIRASLPTKMPDVEYRFRGDKLTGTRDEYHLQGGLFTTCEKETPHYAIRAREIVYRPGERITARRVSLLIRGRPIFTVPRYTADLSEDASHADLFPRLILGRTDRVGLRSDFRLGLSSGATADAYGVLSARHTVRAGVGVGGYGSIPVGLRAGFKEDAPNRFVSGLTVTVLPAVTFHLPEMGSGKAPFRVGLPRYRPTFAALANDIEASDWRDGARYRFIASGSAGHFAEHPTEVSTARVNLTAALEACPFSAIPHVQVGGALRGRVAYYGTGAHYSVLSPELCVLWEPSRRDTLRAQFRHQMATGETPFLFDRVDAARSLSLRWLNKTSQRKLDVNLDLDLNRWSLYNWNIGYSRRIECLQPGVVIHNRGKDFGVGLTLEIPGLGG